MTDAEKLRELADFVIKLRDMYRAHEHDRERMACDAILDKMSAMGIKV